MDRLFSPLRLLEDYVNGDSCGSLPEFPGDSTAAVDPQRYNKGTARRGRFQ